MPSTDTHRLLLFGSVTGSDQWILTLQISTNKQQIREEVAAHSLCFSVSPTFSLLHLFHLSLPHKCMLSHEWLQVILYWTIASLTASVPQDSLLISNTHQTIKTLLQATVQTIWDGVILVCGSAREREMTSPPLCILRMWVSLGFLQHLFGR